ncbi:MAG: ABC1 kinase family protein [Bdellovibrionales bacterium]
MALELRKTLQNAVRLRTIVAAFAKHGFHNIAERIKLGRFLVERLSGPDVDRYTAPQRMRMAFEELGPTFVKLGQLLATRPDLVPKEYADEFATLHDRVQPLPFDTIQTILRAELGNRVEQTFETIEPAPLGSASIAQVHKARLKTGEDVVIKIQRPGIIKNIDDDLSVLYFLAELLERYVPETRPFSPMSIVDEFFKTLELETDFIVEANNIRRFQFNFKNDDQVVIPKVYLDLTTERILVLEMLKGLPLSQESALMQPGLDKEALIKKGLQIYMKMVFIDGLFHGDLHAGNFFVLPDNHVGLIDFGVVGRLNARTQASVASMLMALAKEDYERLAYEYVDLAPFTDQVNVDYFAKELRSLIAPYFGLTLKNVNMGRLLMNSAAVASRHGLHVPTELMMFFKSLVAIEGLGRKINPEFDFLATALEFTGELIRKQYDPQRMAHELSHVARESRQLINTLPRQASMLLKKINSPQHAFKFSLHNMGELKKTLENSFSLMFLGIVTGSLIISGSMIAQHSVQSSIQSLPAMSLVLYGLAGLLGALGFYHYIRKP